MIVVGKGQFTADMRAVVVTVRGILDHFASRVHRATEWYLRKIVVMPLSRRTPPLKLVPFCQTSRFAANEAVACARTPRPRSVVPIRRATTGERDPERLCDPALEACSKPTISDPSPLPPHASPPAQPHFDQRVQRASRPVARSQSHYRSRANGFSVMCGTWMGR